jgi:RNA polymerase sigma factor (sigma-70 family)
MKLDVTNEELMALCAEGDSSALDALCKQNQGLICDRAKKIAFLYHCYRFNDRGDPTAYTIELLSDLEDEGMTAFIECVCGGKYNPEFMLTTYVVPFIDGAMRRYLESSAGTLAIDRDSITIVRRAQELYHVQRKSVAEIAADLGIPAEIAAGHIAYATHFLSVHDCVPRSDEDDDGDNNDVYDYIAEQTMFEPPNKAAYRKLRSEHLHGLFLKLPKKEQDILGKCYGVFGYAQTPPDEIAMYHFMKTDAVEKARNRALGKLQKLLRENPNPWAAAEATIHKARRESERAEVYSTPQGTWYEDEWELKDRFPVLVRALISVFTFLHETLEMGSALQLTAEDESTITP